MAPLILAACLVQTGCVGLTGASANSAHATETTNATPSIVGQPANQTVNIGQTATFSVAVSGTSPFAYQWRRNGTAISGGTSSSYTTPATTTSDNGAQFSVVVSNSSGNVTSNAAVLTVAATAPSITAQPASITVTAGQTATFSVAASGTAPLTYQWLKNGVAIGGASAESYTTPTTAASDSGASFTVVVSNSVGNTASSSAILTVTSAPVTPSITTQPTSQTVTAGQTATFSVTASGTAPLTYQWRKNGTAIGGATGPSYTTPVTATSDSGTQFTVVVSNSVGNLTSNQAILTVNAAAVAPSITSQPASQTVTAGQTATFSVAASGTAPMTYQWLKSGTAISGATSASYTTPATATSDSGSQFTVRVSNSAGSATSNAATLTVNAAAVAPTITTQPANQSVTAGQTATFSVAASGTAPMTYQWRKNGTAISGATSSSYTTPATTSTDNGSSFTVVVSNSAGNATSAGATLTVTSSVIAPSITSQPASSTVMVGQTATFSVTASGTAPFTYQWRKNGTAITGATSSSYTTPATASSDSGSSFSVVVTNSAGSVTSSAATLTVNAAGQLSASSGSLNFGEVTTSGSSSLPVTITNTGGSSITISGVTISGAGVTASGISSGQILNAGQGATLTVIYAPSNTGNLSGSVAIASNASNATLTITLSGTAVAPPQHSATLTWSASTSNNISGYKVYRGSVSGGPYTLLTSSLVSTLTYTDSTVQAGQTYYWVVTAVDSNGDESADSNQASGTIPTP